MTPAELAVQIHAACERRGIGMGNERVRLLQIGLEAAAKGRDGLDVVEQALALRFDEFKGPENPSPMTPMPPILGGRRLQK